MVTELNQATKRKAFDAVLACRKSLDLPCEVIKFSHSGRVLSDPTTGRIIYVENGWNIYQEEINGSNPRTGK